ncbi:Uncharacterised protein [uncultured archaeon]|nr:Uncharacterised protein [uncultured archaeon]
MPIVQHSKIKVRSGLEQNLPALDKGEFGWAVDSRRLFIGNGTISDGAPFAGNTEILTTASTTTSNSSSSSEYTPASGTFQQSPDGNTVVFWTEGNVSPIPASTIVWVNFPQVPGVDYNINDYIVTFANAPASTDHLAWQGWVEAS